MMLNGCFVWSRREAPDSPIIMEMIIWSDFLWHLRYRKQRRLLTCFLFFYLFVDDYLFEELGAILCEANKQTSRVTMGNLNCALIYTLIIGYTGNIYKKDIL